MTTTQTQVGPTTTAGGSSGRARNDANAVGNSVKVADIADPARPNPGPAPSTAAQAARRRRNPRADLAEGVISTAIAVLVIAFLGLMMWFGFRVMFNSATTKANQTIEQIGN